MATGIKKTRVYSNAGVSAPALDQWLHEYTPEQSVQESNRLILGRLQILNTRTQSNTGELKELTTEAARATGNVSKVAQTADFSRQAIYRWVRIHNPNKN